MGTKITMMVAAWLCWTGAVPAATNEPPFPPDRLSFYEVPLVCPAAPAIGCGSRAKPILLQLENAAPVAEAWLNRPGTILAIVWKPESKRKDRAGSFAAVKKTEELKARELKGNARKQALQDFGTRVGWHRGSDVDRLSEEEAGILAARLVRRIQAKVSVPEEKANTLRTEFTDIFKRLFTGAQANNEPGPEDRVLDVLKSHLNEQDVTTLRETLPRDLTPLPGEK